MARYILPVGHDPEVSYFVRIFRIGVMRGMLLISGYFAHRTFDSAGEACEG